MSKVEMIVNVIISVVMGSGAEALLQLDRPMTNYYGLMLGFVALAIAGYSVAAHRLNPEGH